MKKLLITSCNGQLGRAINKQYANTEFELVNTDVAELDITSVDAVVGMMREVKPYAIINCAAHTGVDACETDAENAFRINAIGPRNLSIAATEVGAKMVHISTDYVFDGLSPVPYKEESEPHPLSVYGKSKFEGELALVENPNALIIRSSWLYSEFGNNFLKTMIRLGKEKDKIGVVFDQTGSPTYAPDLAEAALRIIEDSSGNSFRGGLFNFANEGVASWFDLAWEIMDLSGLDCKVFPITTDEYPLPAKRPSYSVLNTYKIKNELNIQMKYWKLSLKKAVERIAKI